MTMELVGAAAVALLGYVDASNNATSRTHVGTTL